MRLRALTAALLATALVVPAAAAAGDGAPAKRSPRAAKKLRLVRFDDCSELVGFARRHAARVQPYYAPGGPVAFDTIAAPLPPSSGGAEGGASTDGVPTAAPAAPGAAVGNDSSSTNVQEAGVDEPDVVKTDGDTIFTIANGDLQAVDARSPQPKLLQTLELGGQGQTLLLHGNKLLVIGTKFVDQPAGSVGAAGNGVSPGVAPVPDYYYRPITILTEVDVGDPANMKM